MTDNEIIAKALGWKVDAEGYWVSPIRSVFDAWKSKTPPQYDSDLNLIHSAEDALTENERYEYLEALGRLVDPGNTLKAWWLSESVQFIWLIRHATAAQCAQELAKVLGGRGE